MAITIPEPPVSAQTHGDPRLWTELFEWRLFREWALSLKAYPDVSKGKKGKGKRTSSSTKKKPASAEPGG